MNDRGAATAIVLFLIAAVAATASAAIAIAHRRLSRASRRTAAVRFEYRTQAAAREALSEGFSTTEVAREYSDGSYRAARILARDGQSVILESKMKSGGVETNASIEWRRLGGAWTVTRWWE
ncbi:MAG: hypothetical protein JO102_03955 [Elusimicrobia bacterium]|nr:hypothetical protein [Elusimicrobiota bacterium]